MDQDDPALQFFPDGNVDLYATLGLDQSATQHQIKKAYKKLALKFHPDKVLSATASSSAAAASSSSASSAQETIHNFQRIGFAYAVLSDEVRRKKYDNTGSTRELGIGQGVDDFDWNEYFKTLWTGEVSKKTLEDFKKNYQGSSEEKEDILAAYRDSDGSLESIFASVPCSEFLVDEQRFIDLVEAAIDAGEIERKPLWTKTSKDKAGRARLRKKAEGEAKEAEKLAKELGVWDDLFGDGKTKSAKGNAKDNNKDKAKTSSSSSGAKKGGKKAKADEEEEEDLAALQALMRRKAQNRASAFDDMIAKMEAKAGGKESRPSEEEFERIQSEMMQRKPNGGATAGSKRKLTRGGAAAETASKGKKAKK
ncbi:hypothetical protein ACQY0O_005031 [Thecaphora frezii]